MREQQAQLPNYQAIIELQDVNLNLQGKSIIDGLSLTINRGDFIIMLGSNGSGKSSLMKLIYRQTLASSGTIYLEQKPITQYSNDYFYRTVKFLNQNTHENIFNQLTVFENYLLVAKKKIAHARNFLQQYLAAFNPDLQLKLDVEVAQLSGGQRQALALALVSLEPPKILLLDEHTSALDPKTAETIMQTTSKLVAQNNISCILTTHDLSIAKKYGNKIIVLRDGRLDKVIDAEAKAHLDINHMLDNYY